MSALLVRNVPEVQALKYAWLERTKMLLEQLGAKNVQQDHTALVAPLIRHFVQWGTTALLAPRLSLSSRVNKEPSKMRPVRQFVRPVYLECSVLIVD
jgi:hypothetical protein